MKILLLSFYFTPDLSAGSFRMAALAEALSRHYTSPHIDVLTAMPNRYGSFRQNAQPIEVEDRVRIRRLRLPRHKSGRGDQARSFGAFAVQALKAVRGEQYDLVVASSSRLMTASLGAVISAWKDIPLYLDIRDIFTETMADLSSGRAMRMILPVFDVIERLTLRQAARINVVSEAFMPHFERVVPAERLRFFPNGIDRFFLDNKLGQAPARDRNSETLVVFAGNVGDGQALHRLIPAAATELKERVRFRVIGDGGRRRELADRVRLEGLANVELVDPVPRDQLMHHYSEADMLLLHLNDIPAFEKVLPSKIFEYGTLSRPILAGVSGYARSFMQKHVPNSHFFEPCGVDSFLEAFESAAKGADWSDASNFTATFSRSAIMTRMAADVIDLGS